MKNGSSFSLPSMLVPRPMVTLNLLDPLPLLCVLATERESSTSVLQIAFSCCNYRPLVPLLHKHFEAVGALLLFCRSSLAVMAVMPAECQPA
jgi:hypothetical protein